MQVGTKLRITKIQDTEDIKRNCAGWHYQNRVGVVERVGEDGLLYGSWGKLGVNPAIDEFEVVNYPDETVDSFIVAQKLKDKRSDDDYWDERDEIDKQWRRAVDDIVPCIGLPCTICYYSDKRAATVTSILGPKKIAVSHNVVKCEDYYAGNYTIMKDIYDRDEDVFTKRKNGQWVMEGQQVKDGVKLMLHYQRHYIDPHF